ncbi:MAG: S9 family peptidase [Alphaproteobacteria bacterium]|nr:MAG: S9 family peptidase [Alphaproteobacteria bacterium]
MNQETQQVKQEEADPYRWLEKVTGKEALAWVGKQNERALAQLEKDPRYPDAYERILKIYTASDRIPYGRLRAGNVDNFWQDESHTRGIWRRTTLASYASGRPSWNILLDIDALAKAENENWVWKGANCLPPDYRRCIVSLSRGGADAVELREFDTQTKRFVDDGFRLDEAKQWFAWLDADHLLIASPLEGGAKNTSGYPRTVRTWKRGTPLKDARTVFEGPASDAFAFPAVEHSPEGREAFVIKAPDFFHQTVHHLEADGSLHRLPLPDDVDFKGIFKGRVIALLRSNWKTGDKGGLLPAGAVVSVPLAGLLADDLSEAVVIVAPNERVTVTDAVIGSGAVYVTILDQVKGRLIEAVPSTTGWRLDRLGLPEDGTVSVTSSDPFTDAILVNYESFLAPDTLYLVKNAGEPRAIMKLPPRFDASRYVVDQFFAESEDEVKVPYFLVHAKDMKYDSNTPTILYGYGGFEISLTPQYLPPMAIEWLKAGGAWAVANIRGGGEFGPRWHQAALKEKRPIAYADFAAVAWDLIHRKVTSPKRLGIYGRSNGGLLVTATMVRYPKLFGAVAAGVPLTDMLRYHKLLAGASWIGEYGNPDIPEERDFLKTYSPYQNVRADVRYPPIFFITSTRDDRVHPGHARKMAAKMIDQGHEVLYYENTEGGHAGAANLPQRARYDALILVFMMQKLMDADGDQAADGPADAPAVPDEGRPQEAHAPESGAPAQDG